MKIHLKFITAFLLVCIIVWIAGIASLGTAQMILQQSIGRHSVDVVEQIADKLSKFLALELREQQEFVQSPVLRLFLGASNAEFAQKNVQAYIDEMDAKWDSMAAAEILNNSVSQLLRHRVLEHVSLYGVPEYGGLFVTNKYGAVVAMSIKTTDYRQDDKAWWQVAKTKGLSVSDVEYDESAGTTGIAVGVRITDAKGNFLGVLKVLIRFTVITNILQELQGMEAFRKAHIKLLDSSGRILYSTMPFRFKQLQSQQIIKHLAGSKVFFIETEPGEEEALFAYALTRQSGSFEGLGWRVLAEHPSSEVFAPLSTLRTIILALSAFAVLLALIIGGFVSASFAKAAEELAGKAQLVQTGKLKARTSIHTHDELEEAGNAFNSMAKQLGAEKAKVSERQKKIETAQVALTHMMARLKDSYEKLKALDRLKDEFLQSTSHELRTPLTSLLGFVRLMKEGSLGRMSRKQREGIDVIESDAMRLANSITKILDTARIEAGKKMDFSALDFNQLVTELTKPLAIAAKSKKLSLNLELGKLPKIVADKNWLGTVITNLVHNAIKYTNQGSITVQSKKQGKNIVFSVKDTGMGIRPEHITSLFSKFFQVTHTTSGSGLGLYICRRIVEQHKGRLWAESEYRKGSTFSFTIPIRQ